MTSTLIQVPLARLRHGPNVREKLDEGLVESIRAHGLIQPITVVKEGAFYTVLMGHRRTAAARRLKLATIPAMLEERVPEGLRLRQLAENVDRKEMDPLEVATALQAELDETADLTRTELARRVGRSQAWVTNKLRLLDLDDATKARLSAGEISEQTANAERKVSTPQTGTGRPRTIVVEDGHVRSRSLEVPLGEAGKATVGVDRDQRTVDLVVQDTRGRGVMVTVRSDAARLLGRRLLQAGEAVRA